MLTASFPMWKASEILKKILLQSEEVSSSFCFKYNYFPTLCEFSKCCRNYEALASEFQENIEKWFLGSTCILMSLADLNTQYFVTCCEKNKIQNRILKYLS